MAFKSIQIFACDHRKNVQWDLPYIRLGNYQSDAAINIKDDAEIAPYQLLLSEGAQMWWASKHYEELGNPDYIGFCHYRRFFSFVSKIPILNISVNSYSSNLCAKPAQLLDVIEANKLDGITFIPLQVTNPNEYKFVDIKDQLKFLSNTGKIGISDEVVDKSFDALFQRCTDFKLDNALHKSMLNNLTYVCNIFILRKDLFMTFSNIVFPVFKELSKCMTEEQLRMTHPRFMGYILERFTSIFLHAYQEMGFKIGIMPLVTIDAHIHEKWTIPGDEQI